MPIKRNIKRQNAEAPKTSVSRRLDVPDRFSTGHIQSGAHIHLVAQVGRVVGGGRATHW